MIKRCSLPLLALLMALSAQPAWAHHSFAMFDRERTIQLTGVIKEFQWVNPHTWVQIVVGSGPKATEWSIEGRSPNVLSRRGWKKSTLKPGDKVTLTVYPLKNGQPGGAIIRIKFPNGQELNA